MQQALATLVALQLEHTDWIGYENLRIKASIEKLTMQLQDLTIYVPLPQR
ncbi:hypothetical protein BASA81_018338, partial [Batrachochytrium salamandrivorans]